MEPVVYEETPLADYLRGAQRIHGAGSLLEILGIDTDRARLQMEATGRISTGRLSQTTRTTMPQVTKVVRFRQVQRL